MNTLPITRESLPDLPATILRDGRVANAVVKRVTAQGKEWTVKDFSSRPWWVRTFVGPWLIGRELKILSRLRGIDGIASESFRIDRQALAVRYVEGVNLHRANPADVTVDYLERLEALVKSMHARDVVHLDLRGQGNVVIRPDGTPGIIDFQSGLATTRMPGFLRRLLEALDRSGVLKRWALFQPEAMGQARRDELERINRIRKLWIVRGYFGLKK